MYSLFKKISYSFTKGFSYIILKAFCRLRFFRAENINALKGPFIIASNHQSYLDPIILTSAVNNLNVRFMARRSLFENYIFGKFISHLGALPVDLKIPKTGLIKKFYKLLKSGEILVIFPEGTRSPEGVIKGGQPGIGYLMSKAKVPVVPVFIKGSAKALPKSGKWIRLCKIEVIIGELIKPERLEDEFRSVKDKKTKYKLYGDYVMHQIRKLANERSNII